MKKLLVLSFIMALNSPVWADDHAPALLEGEGIKLFELEHGFSGKLKEHPIFAGFDHEPFGTTLVLRKNNKTLTTRIQAVEPREGVEASKLSGVLTEQLNAEQTLVTTVSLIDIHKNEDLSASFVYLVDGKEVNVFVKGERFENNHFHTPSFETLLPDDEKLSWKFSGQSCYGYSANIAASLLLANAHLKK